MPADKLYEALWSFWDTLGEMAPYLLLGFFVAGLLSVLISPSIVERHLGGRGIWSVIKAAAVGVPLPLCSCSVIPVSTSLRRHGASRGATTSFLISTPQTGVDSIFVTFGMLGLVFAIFRPIVALITGVLGGALVDAFDKSEPLPAGTADRCAGACCAVQTGGRLRRIFSYAFITLPEDIGKALLVGLLIAAAISAAMPKDLFTKNVPPGVLQLLVLMAVGMPMYVCATASVPIAAALIAKGVSPGAAFAFLVLGPATNAATIAAVWKVMGRRTAAIYLLTMAAGAFFGGLLLDWIMLAPQTAGHVHEHGPMLPYWVNWASALALLTVLGYSLIGRRLHHYKSTKPDEALGPEKVRLEIRGMTCGHCAQTVHKALAHLAGVESATVDQASGLAHVTGVGLDVETMKQAVSAAGYDVVNAVAESEEPLAAGRG